MSAAHMEGVGQYEYDKTKVLGHGAFAVVYRGISKVTPTHAVAVKCISKKQKSSKLLSAEEINILKEVQHENVVQLLDFKETDSHIYMVMEFCNGGDLAEYLRDKGTLSENTLALFVKQLGHAMLAIHERGVMHRDLKPGNILLSHASTLSLIQPRDIKLKIADFGFARFLSDEDMAATLCGSPIYMAPEVLMGLHYDARVDLWSLGTIIYQCFTGKAPFKANNPYNLRTFYEKSAELIPIIPKHTSPELRDLILCLLQKNPDKRITFEKLVEHTFIADVEMPQQGQPSGYMSPECSPPSRCPVLQRGSTLASPRASPSSSPSHNTSRSPSSSSSNKLASMQRMSVRANVTRPPDIKSVGTNLLTDALSESPDTESFVLVNTNKSKTSKHKSIESSFIQKSVAISSSVKTTAMAIPIKHSYSPEQPNTGFMGSPGCNVSPIARVSAIEESQNKVPEISTFNVDSPRRLSNIRNVSAPTFGAVRRTWSLDGQKRHRTSSESVRNSTPPTMELVSKSVRQSPGRRPFSANFEDSAYSYNSTARPLSASRTATGQSAPAFFFIGQSPHTSPPSLTQSPLQLTFGETSPAFTQPPELSETTIMDDHQRSMLDEFQSVLQYCQAIREAANLLETPFSPTDFKDKTKLQEKLILCSKAEALLSTTIHTAKRQLFASKLSPSKTFKEVLYSIYGEFCAAHDMKLALEKEMQMLAEEQENLPCGEEVLLSFALQQIRSGILDENFGNVGECIKRYRLSAALILGLLSEVKSEHDRHILQKYESGLQVRIDNLHGRVRKV